MIEAKDASLAWVGFRGREARPDQLLDQVKTERFACRLMVIHQFKASGLGALVPGVARVP